MKKLIMTTKKTVFAIAALLMAAVAVSATASTTSNDVSYLFVIRSENSTITKENGKYQISMQNPHIIYFTDRPIRDVNKMTSDQLLKAWNSNSEDSFKNVPPNAYVASFGNSSKTATGQYIDNVATLTDPKMENGTMTFSLEPVGDKPLETIKSTGVELVIDSFAYGCGFSSQGGNC